MPTLVTSFFATLIVAVVSVSALSTLAYTNADTIFDMSIRVGSGTFPWAKLSTALTAHLGATCNVKGLNQPAQASGQHDVSISFQFDATSNVACASALAPIATSADTSTSFINLGASLSNGNVGTLLGMGVSQVPPTTPSPPSESDEDGGANIWVYAGAGAVAFLIVVIAVACFLTRRNERRRALGAEATTQQDHMRPLVVNTTPANPGKSAAAPARPAAKSTTAAPPAATTSESSAPLKADLLDSETAVVSVEPAETQ